jgi:glucose/arabinose dehydrogenase
MTTIASMTTIGCASKPAGARRHVPSLAVLAVAAASAIVSPSAAFASVDSPPANASIPEVRPVRVWPRAELVRPTQIVARPDRSDRLFVLEQRGRVVELEFAAPDATQPAEFMDLRDRVNFGGNEEGLLSLAFHPKVAENGRFYLYYTAAKPRRVVISEFRVAPCGTRGDAASERVLLEIPQPWSNHNGGTILFGPDGMLYASIGDGGAANDPLDHGQNLGTLLATVIRIDVDRLDGERPYAIPPDNPFVARDGARPEIWAYGLRNVWRMSFDRKTGELWGGDVGQNKHEEIDLIVKGGNYGWRPREGFHPFAPMDGEPADPFIDPVVEYGRREGISVTGGYVYRGPTEALRGVYLYGDYGSGRMWGLRRNADGSLEGPKELYRRPRSLIASFGEAHDGTLYICTFEGSERPGKGAIWRLDAVASEGPG